MTTNKKILLGIGAGVLIYWAWKRNKAGKSLNPFAKSSSFTGDNGFFNFTKASGCTINGTCPNVPVGTLLDGNRIVVSNTSGCVICPRSNTSTGMPVQA